MARNAARLKMGHYPLPEPEASLSLPFDGMCMV